jgi:hypothetical protein
MSNQVKDTPAKGPSILPVAVPLLIVALGAVGWSGYTLAELRGFLNATDPVVQSEPAPDEGPSPNSAIAEVANLPTVDLMHDISWTATASSSYNGDKTYDYGPERVLEGDTTKGVWVEGAKGDGIGEWVRVTCDRAEVVVTKVRIGIGFNATSPKGTNLWDTNSRPKALIASFSNGTNQVLELQDTPEVQELALDSRGSVTWVQFTIQEVTIGAEDDTYDVCIGSIDLWGSVVSFESPD